MGDDRPLDPGGPRERPRKRNTAQGRSPPGEPDQQEFERQDRSERMGGQGGDPLPFGEMRKGARQAAARTGEVEHAAGEADRALRPGGGDPDVEDRRCNETGETRQSPEPSAPAPEGKTAHVNGPPWR